MRTLPHHSSAVFLAVVFLLALVLRLGFGAWAASVPPPLSDAEYYDATARSLARGGSYDVLLTPEGFRPGGDATAFYPPGYPLFLAAGYKLFGESIGVARALNALAGAATVVPVFWLGRRFWGDAAGLAGAFIVAFSPSLVFWSPVLLSETWFVLLFALSVALLVSGLGRCGEAGWRRLLVAGAFVGLAALVRGQALVLVPVGLAVLLWQGAGWRAVARHGVLLTLGALVVLVPWTVRNASVFDSTVLLSTNFGYNLRVGHAPYASGRYETPDDLWAEPAPDFHALETVFNAKGRDRAIDYAFNHPSRELELSARKVVALWQPDTDALSWVSSYGLTPLPRGAVTPLKVALVAVYAGLMVLAAAQLVRDRRALYARFALLTLVAWTLVHVVFFGEPRYHLPMLVILAPLAGAAAAQLAGQYLRTTLPSIWRLRTGPS